jgi:rSAM/selenodomain-associated transferase 2
MYLKRVPYIELISEIIVSDGNSNDDTVEMAESFGVKVIRNTQRGRAHQMNVAAKEASGDILYFLHADSLPPKDFANEIVHYYQLGHRSGCFRLQFDHAHWFLTLNAWFTRFNMNVFRFGDQSLFMEKELFNSIGGFREDHILLEDQEIISRSQSSGNFTVIPRYITTSARKYINNGVIRLQCIYFYIYTLYRFGVSQTQLVREYHKLIS